MQSRIYVVNRWKYYPDYFPDPLALSELVSREGACVLASFKHTPHQKHGLSQSVTNAGESQWAFDYSAVNLSFEAATFEFVTDASVRALLFTVTGLAAQDGDEDRRIKAWIWVCPRSRMDSEDLDYSARIKWFHFVIMLRIGIFL